MYDMCFSNRRYTVHRSMRRKPRRPPVRCRVCTSLVIYPLAEQLPEQLDGPIPLHAHGHEGRRLMVRRRHQEVRISAPVLSTPEKIIQEARECVDHYSEGE
jgi:hypothetical protein